MANDLLQGVTELEQALSRRSRQITATKLQNLKPTEGNKRQRRRITSGGRKRGDDLNRSEDSEYTTELLERAVVSEVGHVSAKVVNRSAGEHALELTERVKAEVDIVKTSWIELENNRFLEERLGFFF